MLTRYTLTKQGAEFINSVSVVGIIQLRVPLEHYKTLLSEDILYQWSCITTNNALPGKMPVSLIAINHACACSCFCYASDTATHHSTYRGAVSSLMGLDSASS